MTQQSEKRPTSLGPEELMLMLQALFRSAAHTVEVWMHTGRGEDSIMSLGIMGCLLMFFYCIVSFIAYPFDAPGPMLLFMAWCFVLTLANWIGALWRRWRGHEQPHTRYTGTPILMRILPWSEITVKRIEPLLVVAAGWGIKQVNRPLGIWLMIAGFAMLVVITEWCYAERRRVLDMHNSVIEQSNRADQFRRMQR